MINKKVENHEMDENWLNYVENVFLFYFRFFIFLKYFWKCDRNQGVKINVQKS
jgi:hypothetical protein